jgi:uncharacterized protein YdaL
VLQAAALAAPPDKQTKGGGKKGGGSTPVSSQPRALILHADTGDWRHLGELFALQTANLMGRFGTYEAKPVSSYRSGDMAAYTATFYIGSTWREEIPEAFMEDVLAATRPVIWMEHGIHELAEYSSDFEAAYGWTPGDYDFSGVQQVRYKGTHFTRRAQGNGGITTYRSIDPTRVQVLAEAVRDDGVSFPWATRSGNLTYIGEVPFTYMTESDRYIVFADLLFGIFAPQTAHTRRALVRLEDVGPDANPAALREIADYLSSRGVPFSVAVYPVYKDPHGVYNGGVAETITLKQAPAVVSALKYMESKGGTLLMHGYTHQYEDRSNPYNGVSGDDFEFFTAHVNENDYVIYDGPVPNDSVKWTQDRINLGLNEFKANGLTRPTIFEFPHYAGSDINYKVVGQNFNARYERSLYFGGYLSGGPINYKHYVGQFFPYPVTDVYGSKVIPENIGNYEPFEYNNHPTRFPAEIIENARRNLVTTDAFASFFFHPFLIEDIDALKETVEGIQALGYKFVAPGTI